MTVAAYLILLWFGYLIWQPLWYWNNAPFATGLFYIYIAQLFLTEVWLIFFLKGRFKPAEYQVVKYIQRLFDLAVVFYLVNGDLGKLIIIELLIIIAEALFRSPTNKPPVDQLRSYPHRQHDDEIDALRYIMPMFKTTWDRISRFDFELGKFMLVAILVLIATHGFAVFAEARFMLLNVLLYRKAMSVRRQSLNLKPGCPMDRRAAIVQAIAFILIGLLFIFLPDIPGSLF